MKRLIKNDPITTFEGHIKKLKRHLKRLEREFFNTTLDYKAHVEHWPDLQESWDCDFKERMDLHYQRYQIHEHKLAEVVELAKKYPNNQVEYKKWLITKPI